MSPRTGRPKSDSPKSIEVKARIDKNLNDRLEKYCKEENTTRTEVVRRGIIRILDSEE